MRAYGGCRAPLAAFIWRLAVSLVLGVFPLGCMTPAVAQPSFEQAEFTFEQCEVVTGSAKRQTVLTGFLFGGTVAELAVVTIERGASGGSFFTIPPQRQVEIASRKKIITDEHSGRILIDSNLAEEEREKMSEYIG